MLFFLAFIINNLSFYRMCLFFILLIFGPRVAMFFFWLFDTTRFNTAFDSIIWPLLGIIFVPWTTLMYVIVNPGGLSGWDWFWLGLMLLADIASYTSSAYSNRSMIKV